MLTVLLVLTAFTVGVDTRQDIPVVIHDSKTVGKWTYNHVLKPVGHAADKAYHAGDEPLIPPHTYTPAQCALIATNPPTILCADGVFQ
jgi:hypothetical protein